MENPVDHKIDLGFVNYVQHPENDNYIVFRFSDENRTNSFMSELKHAKIWFEQSEQQGRVKMYSLFAVHKDDFAKVEKINYKVEAKHKRKIIPIPWLRTILLLISSVIMILAIIGYCRRSENPTLINKSTQSINSSKLVE